MGKCLEHSLVGNGPKASAVAVTGTKEWVASGVVEMGVAGGHLVQVQDGIASSEFTSQGRCYCLYNCRKWSFNGLRG